MIGFWPFTYALLWYWEEILVETCLEKEKIYIEFERAFFYRREMRSQFQ